MSGPFADFQRLSSFFERRAEWWLCPYGKWTELNASVVIFDRCYRPNCRVKPSGQVEIVAPDEFILFRHQWFAHGGFGPKPSPQTRKIVAELIERFDLSSQLYRRLNLLRRGSLSSWKRSK